MSYEEFAGWHAYFDQRPPGWAEDRRAAFIMRSLGADVKPTQIFSSLAHMETKRQKDDPLGLRGSSIMSLMASAVGGEKLQL
jgi:hypothetical protein